MDKQRLKELAGVPEQINEMESGRLYQVKKIIDPMFDTDEGREMLEQLATYITTNLGDV